MSEQAPTTPRTDTLTSAELASLQAELDALRARVMREVGEVDARYIRRVLKLQRRAEVAGRALLFGGVLPPLWAAGVGLLTLSKVLENMEVGHNVLHGQYDFMNDPALCARNYEWDWACPAAHWRHSHNYVHHTFTNVVGKDRDVGYGLLRMSDEQPWHPGYLLQPAYALGLALAFELGVAVHDLEVNLVLRGEKDWREFAAQAVPFLRKALPQLFKDYVAFPLLAGPAAPLVFAGNLSANVARNVWAFAVIFCGHFPDGVAMYTPAQIEGESRAQWYVRQILGSVNVEGPGFFHVLSGHLSHQIEHHLFPDLPAPRYPQIAGEVRAICQKYGLSYNTGSLGQQLGGALRRIARFTLPTRGPRREALQQPESPVTHAARRAPRSAAAAHAS
jgi:NADPH-dependent stearoyl-CoA 9-desaturase